MSPELLKPRCRGRLHWVSGSHSPGVNSSDFIVFIVQWPQIQYDLGVHSKSSFRVRETTGSLFLVQLDDTFVAGFGPG